MNAQQFIKEYGLKQARDVVSASANALVQCKDDSTFHVNDLKRLVESVDLVNSFGGLQGIRSEAHKDCFAFEKNKPLLRAINDYESIYGEWNE